MNDTKRPIHEELNPDAGQSFEEALAESFQHEEIQLGQLVTGYIMAVTGDVALISVGGKTEALMPRTELGELRPGDGLDAVVTAVSPELRVSHQQAIERREREALRGAYENAIPVEGKVTGRNVDSFLGKSFRFLITEIAEDLSTLVVSRTQVLKEEREQAMNAAWEHIVPEAVLEGEVKSIRDFGVFVDLGGVDGMVHVTELSHRAGVRPSQVVNVGQQVQVKVLEADRAKNRISLSIKALEVDPWAEVLLRYSPGAPFEGTVARKTDFGLFVEILPGVDGLVHLSQLPPGKSLSDEELAPGAGVTGWVKEVDAERRRLSLNLREMATGDPWADAAERYPTGGMVEGVVERVANFGVFVELEPGLTALVPASESDVAKGGDLTANFLPGSRITASVLTVDAARKRISLSLKKAKENKASREFRRWSEDRKAEREPEVTAFGAALMKAMQKEPESGQ
jgi:small subunit ribosomal protein S1